jgi:hypothetical protein
LCFRVPIKPPIHRRQSHQVPGECWKQGGVNRARTRINASERNAPHQVSSRTARTLAAVLLPRKIPHDACPHSTNRRRAHEETRTKRIGAGAGVFDLFGGWSEGSELARTKIQKRGQSQIRPSGFSTLMTSGGGEQIAYEKWIIQTK